MVMAHKQIPSTSKSQIFSVVALLGVFILFADRVLLQAKTVSEKPPSEQLPHQPVVPEYRAPVDPGHFDAKQKAFTPQYARADKPMPDCTKDGSRAKSFLVVFQSRSGSTAICTELRKHTATHMDLMEYLDQIGVSGTNLTGAIAETRKWFDEGIAKGKTPGFKIRAHHLIGAEEEWAKLVKEYGTRVIWQYRKNVIKSTLGTYQSEYLNDSTAIGGIKVNDAVGDRCDIGVGCKFRVDNFPFFHVLLQKRLTYEMQIVRAVHVLDRPGTCTLEVPYEDYLYHGKETMDDIQKFLGLKREYNEPSRVKATQDSLCDVVSNFDDLCNAFYGCAIWQPYFDDMVNNCRCRHFASSPAQYCETKWIKPGSRAAAA